MLYLFDFLQLIVRFEKNIVSILFGKYLSATRRSGHILQEYSKDTFRKR